MLSVKGNEEEDKVQKVEGERLNLKWKVKNAERRI